MVYLQYTCNKINDQLNLLYSVPFFNNRLFACKVFYLFIRCISVDLKNKLC